MSGHYARLECEKEPGAAAARVHLRAAADPIKDQTYFLSQLSAAQLGRCVFPLGALTKREVRDVAHRLRLPNAARPESQGLCFLGQVRFPEFIRAHLGDWPGPILQHETGALLGYHQGFWYFTPGQRRGIRLPGGPWYVTRKDTRRNVVFVSRAYHQTAEADRRLFRVNNLVWHESPATLPPERGERGLFRLRCKTRHGPETHDAQLRLRPGFRDAEAVVVLAQPDQGLASGQFAVFYTDDGLCCASGVIDGFPSGQSLRRRRNAA